MIWLILAAIVCCANADRVGEPDCTKCNFTIGGIGYLPGPNCRQFYQCRMKPGGWTEHVLLCCPNGTRWNQDIKNCDWGHCDEGFDDCPEYGYEDGECPFKTDEDNQAWYFVKPMWAHLMCPAGTVFKQEYCGCVHGYGYMCYWDPLLHFPFAYDFNDIQCPKAAGMGFGDAFIDEDGGYMKLDGTGDYMTFSYLNNYFAGNSPDHFSVSLWFKQDADAFFDYVPDGLFSNGNCDELQSIWLMLNNKTAGGGIVTDSDKCKFPIPDSKRYYGPPEVWCNVVIRFNKPEMKVSYFLNGHEVDMCTDFKGDLANTMSDASVGLAYIHCIPYFFTGCIDDLMVFNRYVSNWEIYACIYGNGRTLGHSEKMYECPEHQPMRPGNGD